MDIVFDEVPFIFESPSAITGFARLFLFDTENIIIRPIEITSIG